jgi:hypothetical protein
MFRNFFFRKSCRLWENVEKLGGAREAADNMTHSTRVQAHARAPVPKPTHMHTQKYVIEWNL